jgi:glycosyltransferase involved in cell wall biosynthesis
MKLVLTGNEPRQKYLFDELRRAATIVAELPFDDIDPLTKYLAAGLSFSLPRGEWWGNFQMHPLIQRRRRHVLMRGLKTLKEPADALLMWGSWFSPFSEKDPGRLLFFNYIDQSRTLSPLTGEREARLSRRRRSYELQAETYRLSSGVICMSEWCRAQTLEAYPALDERKVVTVGWGPCGVDLSAECIPDEERRSLVLHVSNDFYRKGVDFIIESARLVKRVVPQARFVVVGGDSSGIKLPSTNDVEFTGRITDKTVLANYFRRAALFFLPHRFDRSPHVLAEAMSAGLPIVASSQGGAIEVIHGTGVGFMHSVGEIRGYAESIIRLLRDESLRSMMGHRSRELMLERYCWPVVARRILEIMEGRLEATTDS